MIYVYKNQNFSIWKDTHQIVKSDYLKNEETGYRW